MKLKQIIIVSCLLFGGMSCSGFLDEYPNTGINQTEAIRDLSDMEKVLIGVYSPFKLGVMHSGALSQIPDIQCDLFYPLIGFSNNMSAYYQWNFNSQSGEVTAIWEVANQVIARANFLLTEKDKVTVKTTADSLRYCSVVGEAHFARALAYSEMVKLYCDPYGKNLGGSDADPEKQLGLPIVTEFGLATPARANLQVTYNKILEELLLAYQNIPDTKRSDIYFSKAAAKALQARIYLYMRKWNEARLAANYVIDSCDYQLEDATVKNSPYEKMFLTDEGKEIIWKASFSKTDLGGALGTAFYNNSNGAFSPDYVPAQWVLDLYKNDGRYNAFFEEQTTVLGGGITCILLKKYPGNPALWTGSNSNFTNMPKVFRLAEQYLIRAEAYVELSQEDKAREDLQTLQAKRIKGGRAITDVRREIQNERVRELLAEGHRLFDLKRWGLGFKRMPQPGTMAPANSMNIEKENVFFTWPIPSHELDVPGSRMVGNPSNR